MTWIFSDIIIIVVTRVVFSTCFRFVFISFILFLCLEFSLILLHVLLWWWWWCFLPVFVLFLFNLYCFSVLNCLWYCYYCGDGGVFYLFSFCFYFTYIVSLSWIFSDIINIVVMMVVFSTCVRFVFISFILFFFPFFITNKSGQSISYKVTCAPSEESSLSAWRRFWSLDTHKDSWNDSNPTALCRPVTLYQSDRNPK